ncbi:MAG TPA: hypothetical protein VGN64_04455 [Dyadobacter sp.]|jgi:hypothetical protein|nr:hypothetical protein [Dyadobacter sp.]
MKRITKTLCVAMIAVGVTTASHAQFSLGLQGGVAKSNVEDSKTIGGGGINFRVFASPHLALGVAGKIYADGSKYTIAGQTIETTGVVMPLTGTVDYFITRGFVRPYIGGDAGVYFSGYDARLNGNSVFESDKNSNFGAAPRAGLVFAFGNLGIQVEGIYHFVFGNKNHSATTGTANNVDFKSTSKFGGVNVGLIFGLGGK